MNNVPYVTIISWETRNWRHREKALLWCKDYGFSAITRHVFIGEIYTKEMSEMKLKFSQIFTKKTEKFFFATMCKSCFNEGMSGTAIKKKISSVPSFEFIGLLK